MDEQPTITDIDIALTFATADDVDWRTFYQYVDKLLDQRINANTTTP